MLACVSFSWLGLRVQRPTAITYLSVSLRATFRQLPRRRFGSNCRKTHIYSNLPICVCSYLLMDSIQCFLLVWTRAPLVFLSRFRLSLPSGLPSSVGRCLKPPATVHAPLVPNSRNNCFMFYYYLWRVVFPGLLRCRSAGDGQESCRYISVGVCTDMQHTALVSKVSLMYLPSLALIVRNMLAGDPLELIGK